MSLVLMAAALATQPVGITVEGERGLPDVGFRELVAGQPDQAIARIEGNTGITADDPAALINRGTALARLGKRDEARSSYLAAVSSRQRYYLQLADGTWVDSRAAARLAVQRLETGQVLALK